LLVPEIAFGKQHRSRARSGSFVAGNYCRKRQPSMNRHLDRIFKPKAVAVIGASAKEGSVGNSILKNATTNGFRGNVYPINPNYCRGADLGDEKKILDMRVYGTIGDVPETVDLVVVAVRAPLVPDIVRQCGEAGVGGVVIISAGLFRQREVDPGGGGGGASGTKGDGGTPGDCDDREKATVMVDDMLRVSRQYGVRIIGPNCLGIINPSIGLNACFASRMALKGHIAFISQSGALCSSILDWAQHQQVGFSHFVSVGSMIDVGFPELIDYFGVDPATTSILIYMESITDARAFMSAARAFARSKPIIILKAGQSPAGTQAALSHTGTLAGNDAAFEAAFERAGCIRVERISQLFNCAHSLGMQPRPKGNRLAIVTNAGGPGVLCTDRVTMRGGVLAKLPPATIEAIGLAVGSPYWSRGNPVDVLEDASPERYRAAVDACLACEEVDGVLVVLTVQTTTDAVVTARGLVEAGKRAHKPILGCFMGESDVWEASRVLEEGKIPNFSYPESAVDVFLFMWQYTQNLVS